MKKYGVIFMYYDENELPCWNFGADDKLYDTEEQARKAMKRLLKSEKANYPCGKICGNTLTDEDDGDYIICDIKEFEL